jgi:formylmethanofuran dehydrogenase subunit E
MIRIAVPVDFRGTVHVEIPEDVPEADRLVLAAAKAGAAVLAVVGNADAPEEEAFDDYEASAQQPERAEADWDASHVLDIGGAWTTSADTLRCHDCGRQVFEATAHGHNDWPVCPDCWDQRLQQ